MIKKVIILAFASALPLALSAQTNGSNSSYSRYGLGTMAEQSQTFNKGMAGVAQGLRSGKRVNMQNPASYSAIDSLSFIFDVGMSLYYGHLSGNNNSVNVRNTQLSNINAGFHVAKGLGMSFGFMPLSNIGYKFQTSSRVGSGVTTSQPITTKTLYSGDGGIHQIYLGAGWNPFANLSVGANVSYLWGTYNHNMAQTFIENGSASTNYNTQNNRYSANLTSYKIDLGLQYPIKINQTDWLTIGATYGLGHGMKGNATMERYTSANDTVTRVAKDPFSLPHTYSAGVSWQHKNQWVVAADVIHEQWEGCKLPVAETSATDINYQAHTDQYLNSTHYKLGLEYTPNAQSRKYAQTIKYSLGVNYGTPYIKVNGADGPTEYRLTAGLGLPLQTRKLSGRSVINVSAEWLMRKASKSDMITENYLMVNVGITFNERWFMKWKIE